MCWDNSKSHWKYCESQREIEVYMEFSAFVVYVPSESVLLNLQWLVEDYNKYLFFSEFTY